MFYTPVVIPVTALFLCSLARVLIRRLVWLYDYFTLPLVPVLILRGLGLCLRPSYKP